jgi:single-strand DNA-binding protein
MKGLNSVRLIGNLGSDPETRSTPSGKLITTFLVATSRKYPNQDGLLSEETTWHNIVCWDRLAENVSSALNKGSAVYIEGRISNRIWDGKDGQKHFRTEIIASDIIFLDKPGSREASVSRRLNEEVSSGKSLLND